MGIRGWRRFLSMFLMRICFEFNSRMENIIMGRGNKRERERFYMSGFRWEIWK